MVNTRKRRAKKFTMNRKKIANTRKHRARGPVKTRSQAAALLLASQKPALDWWATPPHPSEVAAAPERHRTGTASAQFVTVRGDRASASSDSGQFHSLPSDTDVVGVARQLDASSDRLASFDDDDTYVAPRRSDRRRNMDHREAARILGNIVFTVIIAAHFSSRAHPNHPLKFSERQATFVHVAAMGLPVLQTLYRDFEEEDADLLYAFVKKTAHEDLGYDKWGEAWESVRPSFQKRYKQHNMQFKKNNEEFLQQEDSDSLDPASVKNAQKTNRTLTKIIQYAARTYEARKIGADDSYQFHANKYIRDADGDLIDPPPVEIEESSDDSNSVFFQCSNQCDRVASRITTLPATNRGIDLFTSDAVKAFTETLLEIKDEPADERNPDIDKRNATVDKLIEMLQNTLAARRQRDDGSWYWYDDVEVDAVNIFELFNHVSNYVFVVSYGCQSFEDVEGPITPRTLRERRKSLNKKPIPQYLSWDSLYPTPFKSKGKGTRKKTVNKNKNNNKNRSTWTRGRKTTRKKVPKKVKTIT